jgi:HEAT repeat protein
MALDRLIYQMGWEYPDVAVLTLSLVGGPKVIPKLMETLSDIDSQIRRVGAFGLAWMAPKDKKAISALKKAALEDEETIVRYWATIALDRIATLHKDTSVMQILQQVLLNQDENRFTRMHAAVGMITSKEGASELVLGQVLLRSNEEPNTFAVTALVLGLRGGETTMTILQKACYREQNDAYIYACIALDWLEAVPLSDDQHMFDRAELAVDTAFEYDVPFINYWVAMALGLTGDERAIPILERILEDENWGIRMATVRALSTMSDNPATLSIYKRCIGDPNWRVRLWTVLMVGFIRSNESKAVLAQALKDSDENVQLYATFILGALSNKSDLDTVLSIYNEALDEGVMPARLYATIVLGLTNDEAAIPILQRISVDDPDDHVQEVATLFLKLIKNAPGLEHALNDEDPLVRISAAIMILKWARQEEVMEELIKLAERLFQE